jgi:hypothetical protein
MILDFPILELSGLRSWIFDWHPSVLAQLKALPYPVCPVIVKSLTQLTQLKPHCPAGTIVFAPALGDKIPSVFTTHFKIFCNCPRQFDVFVLPYTLPEDGFLRNGARSSPEESLYSNRYIFTGSLRANSWRTIIFNSFFKHRLHIDSSFTILPTYFHACDEPVTYVQTTHGSTSHAYISSKEYLVREYWAELCSAYYALCPIGDHHGSQRLIEAAYAGAVPILIGDPQMTSVPACIRHLVFALPAVVDIPLADIHNYTITTDQIYYSDDPTKLEPHVSPAWVYNPDQNAIVDLRWLQDRSLRRPALPIDLPFNPSNPEHYRPTLSEPAASCSALNSYVPDLSGDPAGQRKGSWAGADLLHWSRIGEYIEYELKHRMFIPAPNADRPDLSSEHI